MTRGFDLPLFRVVHDRAEECINPKFVITRIDSGNSVCLAKGALAADREAFTGVLVAEFRWRERLPDVIHAHFADAAIRIEEEFDIPFIHTTHSLRQDRRAATADYVAAIEARIAEEGRAIDRACGVIGSLAWRVRAPGYRLSGG